MKNDVLSSWKSSWIIIFDSDSSVLLEFCVGWIFGHFVMYIVWFKIVMWDFFFFLLCITGSQRQPFYWPSGVSLWPLTLITWPLTDLVTSDMCLMPQCGVGCQKSSWETLCHYYKGWSTSCQQLMTDGWFNAKRRNSSALAVELVFLALTHWYGILGCFFMYFVSKSVWNLFLGSKLTHWGWDKMAAIFSEGIFKYILFNEKCIFRLRFHWSLFPRVQFTIFQHWCR